MYLFGSVRTKLGGKVIIFEAIVRWWIRDAALPSASPSVGAKACKDRAKPNARKLFHKVSPSAPLPGAFTCGHFRNRRPLRAPDRRGGAGFESVSDP